MKRILNILLLSFVVISSKAQVDSVCIPRDYSFVLMDSPVQLFTMRQFNQSYLSSYRLFARGINNTCENRKLSLLIQAGAQALLFIPLTHEEGHRSILTVNNIGSISQPYFNKHGAAYVKGVSDQTLIDLRDNDLPTYIRLHTGGLESDYMLTKRMETIGSFKQDDFKNYQVEYWMRKFAILQYYVLGLFKYEVGLEEEDNELERDIVGYDTYGVARHLFRPTMEFYRYTNYEDLTSEEGSFVKRMGYRSLLNLLNPLMLGKENFKVSNNLYFNVGMGYTMSPFGDFVDENIWIKYNNLNFRVYARQFQNKDNWFNGFGVGLNNYQPIINLSISITGHFWQQPSNYDFNTSDSFTGGAIDTDLKWFFFSKRDIGIKAYSFDLGLIYKTKGFMPEEVYLKEHFGIRIGTTLKI